MSPGWSARPCPARRRAGVREFHAQASLPALARQRGRRAAQGRARRREQRCKRRGAHREHDDGGHCQGSEPGEPRMTRPDAPRSHSSWPLAIGTPGYQPWSALRPVPIIQLRNFNESLTTARPSSTAAGEAERGAPRRGTMSVADEIRNMKVRVAARPAAPEPVPGVPRPRACDLRIRAAAPPASSAQARGASGVFWRAAARAASRAKARAARRTASRFPRVRMRRKRGW